MSVQQEWLVIGVVFLAASAVWIAVPKYRSNTLLRLGLAIPLTAFLTMAAIAIFYAIVIRVLMP